MKSWAKCIKQCSAPMDVAALAAYLEYLRDLAVYEEDCQTFADKVAKEVELLREKAISDWRVANAFKQESAQCDWCPM